MDVYVEAIERDGYAVIPGVIDAGIIKNILDDVERVGAHEGVSRRAGQVFGIRNLLHVLPSSGALANCPRLTSLVDVILGDGAKVVRGIYFDKNPVANWKVAWHQDLTIAVREQLDVAGYGSWSMKAGIPHVQPPVSILAGMLTLRLHLDDADESNGALQVLPGSHQAGRLDAEAIQAWKEKHGPVFCPVAQGGVMLMRPLLLHASSAAPHPKHRRVLHFEYSSSDLPGGLWWYDA